MTAAVTGERARLRAHLPESRPINWEQMGVLAAVLAQLGAAIWFASALDRRVSFLEAQLPPGVIQKLDDRTLEMQATLTHLEARR